MSHFTTFLSEDRTRDKWIFLQLHGARSEARKRREGLGSKRGKKMQRCLSNTLGHFWYSSEPGKKINEFNSASISSVFSFFFLPCTQF